MLARICHRWLRRANIAGALTEDEARRIASNIAKLPVLLGQARPDDSLEVESNLSDKRHEAEDTTSWHRSHNLLNCFQDEEFWMLEAVFFNLFCVF